MATIFWIIVGILVVCNWNWVEERIEDLAAVGGVIVILAFLAGMTWLIHFGAAALGIFNSWILSFIVALIFCVGRYKYAG
jgi:hypothetical protein